jgi:hypothetical protein
MPSFVEFAVVHKVIALDAKDKPGLSIRACLFSVSARCTETRAPINAHRRWSSSLMCSATWASFQHPMKSQWRQANGLVRTIAHSEHVGGANCAGERYVVRDSDEPMARNTPFASSRERTRPGAGAHSSLRSENI